jgi:hypothetical protein
VALDAWRRVLNRRLGIASIIPPLIGRPTEKPLKEWWRRHMKRLLRTKRSRRRCRYTQRWQETEQEESSLRRCKDELTSW